ncbi:hypothetical protein NFC81_09145 [Salinispirillum sp. LH 10-3-1]|uniref:DUF2802 domain-containing protein n=1 Tax=Salinispirillum sp. LH 10-3-1 TaxID=2952525 RepID=A0AB38YCT8_9GAMM
MGIDASLIMLVIALIGLGTGGLTWLGRSNAARIENNQAANDQKLEAARLILDKKIESQYQALHDRCSNNGDRLQKLQMHMAENYVRNDHLEKAITKTENAVLKEVHNIGDKVELMNRHITHLIQALGKDKS